MRDLEFYKNNAVNNGICSAAIQEWSVASDKYALMRLVTKPYAIPYFINSLNEGWGIDGEYISTEFREYTNGDFVVSNDNDGAAFKSVMLYDINDTELTYNVDVAVLVNCNNTTINIDSYAAQYHIANNASNIILKSDHELATMFIHLYDNASVDVSGIEGNITIYKYSDNATIIGPDKARVRIRNIKDYM